MQAVEVLQKYFGYPSFRPGQEAVIETILSGRDCLAIMPTGAGKSLCFQIPALLLQGLTLVISPLISLMKDQVDALTAQHIPAVYINSQCTLADLKYRLGAIRSGRVRLVYVSPERLQNEFFTNFMQTLPVAQVVVDEAHCVSQWGHDFRPGYGMIKAWVDKLPERPIISAFTATATEKVKTDMLALLGLDKPRIFIGSFDRPNLYFRVVKSQDKLRFVISYLQNHLRESGIIYVATRKEAERVYAEVKSRGYAAGRYHAGLEDEERKRMQEDFSYDRISVMVATNAFGMGIDKSNVRFVIHYQIPGNLESYYQEAGRAGRDGAPSECILLFHRQDVMIQRYLIEQGRYTPEKEKKELYNLQRMVQYGESHGCLRHAILDYFGENVSWQRCERCGNCQEETVEEDRTPELRNICLCIDELKGRFGSTMVCLILAGNATRKVLQYGFEHNAAFGLLADIRAEELRDMVQQAIENGYIRQAAGRYPTLSLTAAGRKLLQGQSRAVPIRRGTGKVNSAHDSQTIVYKADQQLFEQLCQCRHELSQKFHIPPFVIFSDATLWEMAHERPVTVATLGTIKGVGTFKLNKYGKYFIRVIQTYINKGSDSSE